MTACVSCGGGGQTSESCGVCGGTGNRGWKVCPICGGRCFREHASGATFPCGDCSGDGVVLDACEVCGGAGGGERPCGGCGGSGAVGQVDGGHTDAVGADGAGESDRLSRALGVDPSTLDRMQTGLDVVGLLPVAGELADGLSALLCVARGDYLGAGLSAASMIPIAGWGGAAAKWVGRLKDAQAGQLLDGSALRGMAAAAADAGERRFLRQLADVSEDAVAKGRASPAQVDLVLRRAGDNSDSWRATLEARERAAARQRRDITEHLSPAPTHDARTAGTGGIWDSHSGISRDNELVVTMNGQILQPVLDARGNVRRAGLEKSLAPASSPDSLRGAGYDRAHLWGPQFGDEAAAGVMHAPSAFNRGQQRVLEDVLRGMRDNLREGERLVLQARATSFPRDQFGGAALRRGEYDFAVVKRSNEIVERVGVVFDLRPPTTPGWVHRVVPGGLAW